ncbi:MAG: TIGR04283 family arsenosugar biosynthesis glycosyltransferase [Deltaproteobacteria bacterium]|nr:TIGR04283 family arsenosugar biosynthesis glycosyltransferase [Deltaproteobacteria bacterium]
MKVSVIIPALNEAENLRDALSSVGPSHEVIVADGSSADSTCSVAESLGATVVTGPAGRGQQMDAGAQASTGEVLLFLHADTRLPVGWMEDVTKAVSDGYVAGAFSLSIGSEGLWLRAVERVANLRSRIGLIYGDQAIFVKRESFFKAGGFNKLPLMEDVDCVKRLRKLGKVVVLEKRVTTSARRWAEGGHLKNTLKNWLTLTLYFCGVGPGRLYSMYYKK